MKISLLCSDARHPVNAFLQRWMEANRTRATVELVRSKSELSGGDILFLISCSEIITADDRAAYLHSLVLHASDLPHGRGWSPHIWRILEGAEEIVLSLITAEDRVDTGCIWRKIKIPIAKDMLWDEINHQLFLAEIELIDFAVSQWPTVVPVQQDEYGEVIYYPRRKPEDSKINPRLSIEEQFDQIRVCDPVRYPAFFELHGCKYKLTLEKING
ncbi:formyltransferase family protein [Ectopseudomonas alcaliphila]|uniref:formyltransferase family protein n=1 Tax=Ectopseudomonas alcaliphila TaxID=101564 RepID=UPI0027854686|nr:MULTISPECIES: formyltransferase family protein [Pseudomonas]MDP9940101.1 methionyl-tRNA formyltransferase [Pseudomonas sp. 3400]MDR7012332.1 methionyl-tRNA formyltransferase [Pseudomonas alcaliphila]